MTISRGREFNFLFAFNDIDFSDRILRLEIISDDEDEGDDDTDSGEKIPAVKYDGRFSCLQNDDSESSDGAKITTLHISSPILAEKSTFFYKMFKSGMRESHKNEVCLKINAFEEATLMDLLRFMYGETALNATSFSDLVNLLIVADKFEVNSCMSHCVEMLLKFSMSLEHALLVLELPSSVLVSEIVKPLIDAAKKFVFAIYKDFDRSQDEAMQLPLSAIVFVLGSMGLQVASEDNIFDFVLKWARTSYPKLEERREILTKRLAPLISFPNMSVPKLKEVLACTDFEHVSEIVMGALFSKVQISCGQLVYDSKDLSTNELCSAGRVYSPHCVVFFDLTKGQCAGLFPNGKLDSSQFRLGGQLIHLSARCGDEKDCLGLFVMVDAKTCTLDFELAVIKKSSMEFERRVKVHNLTIEEGNGRGLADLLGITWTELMSDDNDYFIDGILRLRVELTLKA